MTRDAQAIRKLLQIWKSGVVYELVKQTIKIEDNKIGRWPAPKILWFVKS